MFLQKIKDNLATVLAIVVAILIIFNLKQCSSNLDQKDEAKKFDKAIAALNDSITKYVNAAGDTVFGEKAVSFDIDDVVNSEAFKSLSEKNKQFYLEIKKQKNVIARAQATIAAQGEVIKSFNYDTANTTITDSGICFTKGATKKLSGNTEFLSYTNELTFGDSLGSNLEYTYSSKIETSFLRQKDKSILVEYKLSDSKASILDGQSFIIPQEQQTKWQKFLNKTGRWAVPAIAFAAGGYIGYKLK